MSWKIHNIKGETPKTLEVVFERFLGSRNYQFRGSITTLVKNKDFFLLHTLYIVSTSMKEKHNILPCHPASWHRRKVLRSRCCQISLLHESAWESNRTVSIKSFIWVFQIFKAHDLISKILSRCPYKWQHSKISLLSSAYQGYSKCYKNNKNPKSCQK